MGSRQADPSAPLRNASLGMTRLRWDGSLRPRDDSVSAEAGWARLRRVLDFSKNEGRVAGWLKPSPDTKRKANAGPHSTSIASQSPLRAGFRLVPARRGLLRTASYFCCSGWQRLGGGGFERGCAAYFVFRIGRPGFPRTAPARVRRGLVLGYLALPTELPGFAAYLISRKTAGGLRHE